MGKTVAAVAGVVIGVVIAVAAPYLAPMVFGTVFTSTAVGMAVATALIGATLSVGLVMGMRALGVGAPSSRLATAAPTAPKRYSYPQGTAIISRPFGPPPPRTPLEPFMKRIRAPWPSYFRWRAYGRFHVVEIVGNCMEPLTTDKFAIIDLCADISRGDLVSVRTQDHLASGQPAGTTGIVKRFIGVNRDLGFIEIDCTNPPTLIHTGLTNIVSAYRVCATAPSPTDARRILRSRRCQQSTIP